MSCNAKLLLLLVVLFTGGCNSSSDLSPAVSASASNDPIVIAPTPGPITEPRMPILKQVAKYIRSASPESSQAIADHANSLLAKYGFEYHIDLEKIVTTKVKQPKTKPVKMEGDDFPYVRFELEVTSKDGKKSKLALTAPAEGVCCCGFYYTPVPVTKITARELTLVINSQEFAISRPKDFPVVQEYILYEDDKKPSKLRSWEVPFETYPYGLSVDGKKLYIELSINEVLLEISEDGSLKFVPKNAEGIVTPDADLRKTPPPNVGEVLQKSGEFGLMQYTLNGTPFILEFPYPCP
jgi:hypothetical protein